MKYLIHSLIILSVLSTTSAFALNANSQKSGRPEAVIDKDIRGYVELVRLEDPLDRGIVSACMQLLKIRHPGQYTLGGAFLACSQSVKSL